MSTIFLATVIGWYLVITSLFLLLRHTQVKSIMADIVDHRALFFMVALLTLIIGLLIVVSHNVWVWGWPVVITILGWLVLLSGFVRLLYLDKARSMANSFIHHPVRMQVVAGIFLLIGLFLLFHVYYPLLK